MSNKLKTMILSALGNESSKLDSLRSYVDEQNIPNSNSKSGKLLVKLLDGKPHEKTELVRLLDDDPRSQLQELGGKSLGYWLIHNLAPQGQRGIYQIDHRHLTCNYTDDLIARKIQRLKYANHSKNLSISHSSRLPKALTEYESALEAANDPNLSDKSDEVDNE